MSVTMYRETKGGAILSTPGGSQRVIVINESGLYSLILSSKLEHSHRSDGPRPGAPAHTRLLFAEGREEGAHVHDVDDERSAESAERQEFLSVQGDGAGGERQRVCQPH